MVKTRYSIRQGFSEDGWWYDVMCEEGRKSPRIVRTWSCRLVEGAGRDSIFEIKEINYGALFPQSSLTQRKGFDVVDGIMSVKAERYREALQRGRMV